MLRRDAERLPGGGRSVEDIEESEARCRRRERSRPRLASRACSPRAMRRPRSRTGSCTSASSATSCPLADGGEGTIDALGDEWDECPRARRVRPLAHGPVARRDHGRRRRGGGGDSVRPDAARRDAASSRGLGELLALRRPERAARSASAAPRRWTVGRACSPCSASCPRRRRCSATCDDARRRAASLRTAEGRDAGAGRRARAATAGARRSGAVRRAARSGGGGRSRCGARFARRRARAGRRSGRSSLLGFDPRRVRPRRHRRGSRRPDDGARARRRRRSCTAAPSPVFHASSLGGSSRSSCPAPRRSLSPAIRRVPSAISSS